METPDPPNDIPGASKQVVLTPHDIPRILRAVGIKMNPKLPVKPTIQAKHLIFVASAQPMSSGVGWSSVVSGVDVVTFRISLWNFWSLSRLWSWLVNLPPPKGNHWLISPDHKALFLMGGTWPGGVGWIAMKAVVGFWVSPNNPWTLQWRGGLTCITQLCLWVLKIATFEGSGFLGCWISWTCCILFVGWRWYIIPY